MTDPVDSPAEDQLKLQTPEGGVAVVTGAGKRLGKQIAISLARQLDLDIVIHCGQSVEEADQVAAHVRAIGRQSVVVSADLSSPPTAAKSIFEAARSLGMVRVLVNCAAVFDDQNLNEIDVAHCDRHFNVNTLAPLFLTQQFARQLTPPSTGHVVNILDWRAQRPPASHLVYTATKAALLSLTRGLAQQLAPRVQVNAIAPGAILPPPERPNWHADRAIKAIPLQRPGSPSDVCEAVVFLLKSQFITGEILHVSGGEEL